MVVVPGAISASCIAKFTRLLNRLIRLQIELIEDGLFPEELCIPCRPIDVRMSGHSMVTHYHRLCQQYNISPEHQLVQDAYDVDAELLVVE
jgi:hypothetical protein